MSTLTIANACISQRVKERNRDAVKNTVCDHSFISETSGSRRYKPFFNGEEFRFRHLPLFMFGVIKTIKRRRFVNISRKICYGFLCFCRLFWLHCEPQ